MSITYKHQKSARNLLSLIQCDQNLLRDCNREGVLQFLNSVIEKDLRAKTCDPNICCWYEYDNDRCGEFYADSIVPLSVYIANNICDSKFSYSDVLGKHSELDFTITEVEYEYCSDSTKCKDCYHLDMEHPNTNYGDDVYEYVLDGLKKRMNSLVPMYSKDYMIDTKDFKTKINDNEEEDEHDRSYEVTEYARHEYLMEYGQYLLDMKLKTNDPCVKLSIVIKDEGSWFGGQETFKFQIKLSQLLTLWAHGAVITKYEYGGKNKQIQLKDMKVLAVRDCNTYGEDFNKYWNENKEKFEVTHGRIMDILNTYPKLGPLEFNIKYKDELIERCKLLE
ncbi:Hypothetical protein ORPV_1163 [Orpheovirus IHUMI-LCC2]|uniref:Uncharacterized protein n=1 Tax=Orpheovirus IHUMI-LCC2 TaxID=2023057 RepID=A0A2I2L6B2_9VIRU|nr:Hypothetical protein ORPV_1163 [Orpheovirus IHUMI-LCC2]SNW63067.1 Hypothetical protein ORPV_1163 [Orpheovirus IHUMI-LCC2]